MAAVASSGIANPATNAIAIGKAQSIQDVRASKEYKDIWDRLKKVAESFAGIKGEYNEDYTAGVPGALRYTDQDQAVFAGYVTIFCNHLVRNKKLDSKIQQYCSAVIRTRVQELGKALALTNDGKAEYDARRWSQIGDNLLQALNDEAPPSCCVIL